MSWKLHAYAEICDRCGKYEQTYSQVTMTVGGPLSETNTHVERLWNLCDDCQTSFKDWSEAK